MMKLSYNPYQIFKLSKTPAGLYARQKWLGEAETKLWEKDFKETVSALMADQSGDGSWNQSFVETATHLFGLHLTVREPTEQIHAAIDWLLGKIKLGEDGIQISFVGGLPQGLFDGLPFIASRRDMLLVGATLFMASIFDRHNDPACLAIYRWLSLAGVRGSGLWFDCPSSYNIFRAMVVHPTYARDSATIRCVATIGDLQTDSGKWGNDFPFYQTLNALAHLDSPLVNNQLEKAFKRLIENQNEDGTWSRTEPEWNTFLTIHALRNKGIL